MFRQQRIYILITGLPWHFYCRCMFYVPHSVLDISMLLRSCITIMNAPPEINVNPIPYYQVTLNPRQEKVYPLHTSKGLPALPLKSETLTWYKYVRVKVYPNRVQLSCTQIG